MAKKKKPTPEEEAKIQLEEAKKNQVKIDSIDSSNLLSAAPTQVTTSRTPSEGIVLNGNTWTPNKMVTDPVGARKDAAASIEAAESVVKPRTIQDIFNEHKQNAIKEQTNAQKMQQYYALADVLKSFGQMGGGMIGGALNGKMVDSMPNVGEYKESRGYINAFENAKKAKDRLRELDNMEYQLALVNDDRTWKQQQAALDREFRSKEQQLARDWDVKFFDYKTKIEQAIADKNLAAQQKWQKELMADKQAYKLELAKIRGDYELKARRISAYSGGRGGKNTPEPHTIVFEDNTTLDMTPSAYKALFARYENSPFGADDFVNEENFNEWVRKNKSTVVSFNDVYTKKPQTPATPPANNAGTNTGATNTEEVDYSQYKKKGKNRK